MTKSSGMISSRVTERDSLLLDAAAEESVAHALIAEDLALGYVASRHVATTILMLNGSAIAFPTLGRRA
jgi:hypothetical protein